MLHIFKLSSWTTIMGRLAISIMGIFGFAGIAQAQFPGDVFVENPSIASAPGEIVEVSFLAFSGDVPFGATGIIVNYDRAALKFLDATRTVDGLSVPADTSLDTDNGLILAAVNGEELDGPLGTVELATLRFRIDQSAVGRYDIGATARGFVDTTGRQFGTGRAFGAEIFVNASQSALRQSTQTVAKTDTDTLTQRARLLRRPGYAVDIVDPANGKIVRVENIDETVSAE